MIGMLSDFKKLVNAEEYFEFFKLPYDQQVLNVNRLHILKRFSLSMKEIDQTSGLSDEERLSQYRSALEQAYEVFLESTAVEQKLFKVFQEKHNNVVLLTDINAE